MKIRSYLSWPRCGLILYLLLLFGGLIFYLEGRESSLLLRVSELSSSAQPADGIKLSVRGTDLDPELKGYLTLDTANRQTVVGNFPAWGRSLGVEVVADRAYVLEMGGKIHVFDLTSPLDPELLNSIKTLGRSWSVDADESRIYLSTMAREVVVYSLASRSVLYVIHSGGKSFTSIHRNNYLYVANGKQGLSIFDVSSSSQARLLKHLALPGDTVDVAFLDDDLIVVANKSGGLRIVDISKPAEPRVLRTASSEYRSYNKVLVIGNTIYAASNKDFILDVYSFSQQGGLSLQTSLPLWGRLIDFLVAGQRLFLAESSYGVSALDVSDPTQPHRIGYVGVVSSPTGLAMHGDYLYVSSYSAGVQILDMGRLMPHRLPAVLNIAANAVAIELDDDWVYLGVDDVVVGSVGLQVVERSDPNNLRIVASLATVDGIKDIVKKQDILYLASKGKKLLVVDVRDPLQPRVIRSLRLGVRISDLAIKGTSLYVSSIDKKLLRIDISDPENPWVAEVIGLPGKGWRIALAGDYVFVAAGNAGLQVLAFAAGKPGRLVGQLTRPWPMTVFAEAFGIAVRGDYAYLIQGEEGLQIIDISRPESPLELTFLNIPGQSLDVVIAQDFAVVSSRWNGYYFVDISNPKQPFLAANIFHPRSTTKFQIEGGWLYATGHKGGLSVLPLPLKAETTGSASDLAFSFSKPQLPGWYDLSVTDGERLETLESAVEID